jgi:hypothetical protein
MKKLFLPYLLLALCLTACSESIATPALTPAPLPSLRSNPLPSPSAFPRPLANLTPVPLPSTSAYIPPPSLPSLTPVPFSSETAYPAPVTLNTSTPAYPLSGYEPQAGDTSLKRDAAVIDMARSQVVVTFTKPVQVKAMLTGSVSDACHYLRVKVSSANAGEMIVIQVYSLFDANIACTTGVKPFTLSIPLGFFATGQHVVIVAATYVEALGQFDADYAPQPGDLLLRWSEVTLDTRLTGLATTGGDWNMPAVNLQGTLQSSCQRLRIVMPPPDNKNKVHLEVYSVIDPLSVCTRVIQPFKVVYPLGYAGSGQSTVYVNGRYVGKFDWGG